MSRSHRSIAGGYISIAAGRMGEKAYDDLAISLFGPRGVPFELRILLDQRNHLLANIFVIIGCVLIQPDCTNVSRQARHFSCIKDNVLA